MILASSAEREGSIKPNSSMKEDVSHSPSAVRENITTTTDFPPQLPSLSPVTDVVIDGPSTPSFGTEHIEHRPLDPTPTSSYVV